MDLNEKVAYEKTISAYIESHKLPDLVESLTRELVINQPADPIQFLMDHISSKRSQRLIFVTGSHAGPRKDIVDQISRTFNYAVIDVEAEEGGVVAYKTRKSELTNERVKARIGKVEKHFRGVVISGYPFDFETAIFAQQNGLIPDRIFILSTGTADLKAYYESVYTGQPGLAELAVQRDKLNKKELKQMYNGFYDKFNVSKMHKLELAENIKNILKIKDKIIVPLRSPRVIVIRPPHLRARAQQVTKSLAQRYGFNSISTFALLDQHIQDKTEIGKFVYQAMLNKSAIPDDIIIGLIRAQMLNTSSKKRGYVLEGFPRNLKQVDAITSYAMNPHLIIVIDQDDDQLTKQLKQLKVDSLTGRHYENLDENIATRLVMSSMTDKDIDAKIAGFRAIIDAVDKKFGGIVQKFKLSTDTNEKIIKTIDIVLNNASIYS